MFWTNAGLLLIGLLGTNFSEILIEILAFSFKEMRLKVSSAKRRPFCLGLNVLKVLGNTSNPACSSQPCWQAQVCILTAADWSLSTITQHAPLEHPHLVCRCSRHLKTLNSLWIKELLNFHLWIQYIPFNVWVRDCVEFQREPLKFHTNYPTHT